MLESAENSLQEKFYMTPSEAIQNGSKSFALASVFLPRSSRHEALLLYRWLRNCDDLIDEAPDVQAARERLEKLESAQTLPLSLRPPSWVDVRFRSAFIAGLRMDVENTTYPSLRELEVYCFRVAGVVGLMMCPVIGAHREFAPPHATALGIAMQLTNISRDIQADAIMGRVYVPRDLLPNATAKGLAQEPERAMSAVQVLLKYADKWYEKGFQGLAWLPLRTAFAIAVAGLVYRKIGHKLLKAAKRNPIEAFRRRTVVSKLEKVSCILAAVWLVAKVNLRSRIQRAG